MNLFSSVPTVMPKSNRATYASSPARSGSTIVAPSTIRVAYVIDSLKRGGTQTVLVNLVSGLAQRSYKQRVYCLNGSANPDVVRSLRATGANVVIIGKLQLLTLVGFVRLLAAFWLWRPHVVQTFLPFADTIGRTVARIANVPIIMSSIRARNMGKRPWQFFLDRITVRWADKVIFNTRTAIPFALMWESVDTQQVIYIPNGVRIEERNCPPGSRKIHFELGIPPTSRVIGTVGRLHAQKGHRYLLNAFANLVNIMPDTILLIVGDGPLRNELAAQAAQRGIAGQVHFLGDRSDIADLLACMDVYVQASTYEGMSNALMEAMAAGRPVVATRVDGTNELITDGETGWLVEPADETAMADRVLYVLQNPTAAARAGAAAALRMAQDFSVQKMTAAYDSLYRQLIAQTNFESVEAQA